MKVNVSGGSRGERTTMIKFRLLSTTAAILLLAAGAASAQGMKQDDKAGAAPAPSAQQKAPAEKSGQPIHSNSGMKANENKSTQNKSDLKQRQTTGQAPKSSDMDKSKQTTGQAPKSSDMDKSPSATSKGSAEMKGKNENGASPKSSQSAQPGVSGTTQQSTQSGNAGASSTTTGQGSAAGSAKLSTEQRTRITSVIRQQNVQRVEPAQLHTSITVGARIPTSVHFYPLPAQVVSIYPEWRGYDYILVGDQILVINPRTHEIVAILEA